MPDLPNLIAALNAADVAQRRSAAESLTKLGPEAQVAAVALARAAGDDDEQVREWVSGALEELGPPSADAVPELAALLSHESADVAYWAATLLGRLEADAAAAVPPLAVTLQSPAEPQVRQRAAWALGQIGTPAEPALGALKEAAGGDDPRLARLAQQAIARITGH